MARTRSNPVRGMALRAAVAAATVVGAGGVLSVSWPGPASADVPVSAVGWWTQSPSPPTVPEGGISVATAPSGSISVAAIKLDTGGGASSATITLAEDSGQGQQAAAIEACATNNNWAAKQAGTWGDAPPPDCRQPVPLTRDANGNWSGDVRPLLSGTGQQSVMIVPTPAAAGLGNVPFQIAFKPPTIAGTTSSSSDSSSSSSSGSSSTATSPAYSSDSSSSSTGSTSSPSFSSATPAFSSGTVTSDTSASATPAPAAATAPPTTAAPAPTKDETASGQFKVNLGNIASSGGHHSTRGTALGLFALALFVGGIAAGLSWTKANGYLNFSLLDRFRRA